MPPQSKFCLYVCSKPYWILYRNTRNWISYYKTKISASQTVDIP